MKMSIAFWKDMFKFQGKLARKAYWVGSIVNAILLALLFYAISYSAGFIGEFRGTASETTERWVLIIFIVEYLVYFLACMSAAVKRLRDAGFSPWFVLGLFFPLLNMVVIVLLVMETKQHHHETREAK